MTKKLLLTLAAAIMLVVLIAGISSAMQKKQPEAEESSAVESDSDMIIVPSAMPERISLDIPAGFSETKSEYYDKYYIYNDASVIVTGEELSIYGQEVAAYSESVKEQYQNTADDFVLLSEEETMLDGVPCRILEFNYAIKAEDVSQDMQCLTAIIIKDERVYLVTCKSRRENFLNYREAFRRMINSITIADESADPFAADVTSETDTNAADAEESVIFVPAAEE